MPGNRLSVYMVILAGHLLFAVSTNATNSRLSKNLVFACSADNDLYRAIPAGDTSFPRHETAAEAIEAAPDGGGVLVLADGYPTTTTAVTPRDLALAAKKNLRLYVEYPAATTFPDLKFGEPRQPHWERTVVASDAFGDRLQKLRILQINDCYFLPLPQPGSAVHLVSARVAGYDQAVYGLPEESWPLLFEHPRDEILIATTKLSQFVSGRYAPSEAWEPVWKMILTWLSRDQPTPDLQWTPSVRPSFAREEALPTNAEHLALRRGLAWFETFLVAETWKDELKNPAKTGCGPADPKRNVDRPIGDGSHGILEGHISKIFADGRQPARWLLRGDCNAESSMAFALAGLLDEDPRQRTIAANLMNFVYSGSGLYRDDPGSPTFGLLGWFAYGYGPNSFWGNDGSKAIIGSLAAAAALDDGRWNEKILTSILANFRTTGPFGFRDGMPLNAKRLEEHGWEFYAQRRTIAAWPQREAWAWACYLWLYDKTKYEPLLVQARKAIRLTMERYPGGWGYALNEMQMERGRILLPLTWLVRVDDTPEHREWLDRIITDMLARQDASGAIREQLRSKSHHSNEDYGKSEVSILHEDGDPCADVFYSVPPAFVGLVEAAAATGNPRYAQAADRVAEFLVRAQVRSEAHPDLDGGWFRAFDLKRWDYWGGNGDSGWGAWSSETGWVQSHIVAALAMRELKTSLWEFSAASDIAAHFDRYRQSMEIDKAVRLMNQAAPKRVPHLASGKPVTATVSPDPRHPGAGVAGLTDGEMGEPHDLRLGWMGFRGADVNATIDLGELIPIESASVHFLQSIPNGMTLPRNVELTVSHDGKEFRVVATREIKTPVERNAPGLTMKPQVLKPKEATTARFIRFRATSAGMLPSWHPAAGSPTWLFVDEIVVR
ncbi:MAG: hypothetical protein ACPGVU_02985 [Limisphaerales bacterium]